METNILPKLRLPQLRRHPEFRGQSVATGEWVFGSLLDHTLPDGCCDFCAAIGVPYQDGIGIRLKPIPVKVETVGECTAAKDRNGNYVYEDDALKQEDADGVYVVFYNEKYTRWEARHTYGFTVELSQLLPPPSAMGQPQPNYLDAEIVGNIHDDPTLGKTRKKV